MIDTIDLNYYSRNMPALYHRLKSIKKSHFTPNDRIVFVLSDHDFYFNNRGPGWSLYNLQLILDSLDISNFFCLLLTNQPNYNDYTRQVQLQLTNDDFPIRSITTLLNSSWFPGDTQSRAPLITDIKKHFCVLSRQSRPHRTFFIAKLLKENLNDYGVIGYNNIVYTDQLYGEPSEDQAQASEVSTNFSFLTIPKHWQRLILKNKENNIILTEFQDRHSQYKNFYEDVNLSDKDQSSSFNNSTPISQAFLYVGLETEVQLEKPFTSRISLRGILEQRPFVIFGCPGVIKYLHSCGFKTFGEFWDESYDDIVDLETRVEKIINVIKYVSSLPQNQLIDLYNKIRPIIEYNYNFFLYELEEIEKSRLHEACIKNLSSE